MLLRRLMHHAREENWFMVLVDFLMVVSGVFVGFQVNDWNEERKRDDKTNYYMERLHKDHRQILDHVTARITDMQSELQSLEALNIAVFAADAPAQDIVAPLDNLLRHMRPTDRSSAIVEMLLNQSFGLIRDKALTQKLLKCDQRINRNRLNYEERNRNSQEQSRAIYLLYIDSQRVGPEVARTRALEAPINFARAIDTAKLINEVAITEAEVVEECVQRTLVLLDSLRGQTS